MSRLPPTSLGGLLRQGKKSLQAPWLGIAGFVVVAPTFGPLVFVGEVFRDAFDPRDIIGNNGKTQLELR